MKKILPLSIISLSLFFTACKQNKDMAVSQNMVPIDTASMPVATASADISKAQPGEKIRERIVYVDRPAAKAVTAPAKQPVAATNPTVVAPAAAQPKKDSIVSTGASTSSGTFPSSGNGSGTNVGSGSGTSGLPGQTTTNAPAPQVKKNTGWGWSNEAKGAAIGGVGGAVAGAILSKKKGKGALIGGMVGAVGGLIIGNSMDKKAKSNSPYQLTNNGY